MPPRQSQRAPSRGTIASRRPRWLQDGPRRPKMPPRALPRAPREAKIIVLRSHCFSMLLGFWGSRLFGFPALQDGGIIGAQDRPEAARGPLGGPGWPQDGPRGAQEGRASKTFWGLWPVSGSATPLAPATPAPLLSLKPGLRLSRIVRILSSFRLLLNLHFPPRRSLLSHSGNAFPIAPELVSSPAFLFPQRVPLPARHMAAAAAREPRRSPKHRAKPPHETPHETPRETPHETPRSTSYESHQEIQ